jgi:FkbM family methyltransferase
MSLMTSPPANLVRQVLRKTGMGWRLSAFINRRGYEALFDAQLMDSVRADDVVWDIGANVGVYTRKFAEAAPDGLVVAFEPSSRNADRLRACVAGHPNVQVAEIGLGSADGEMTFEEGTDGAGSNARILTGGSSYGTERRTVAIRTGDSVVREGTVPSPTMFKLDVEGFEVEVLKGMHELLRSPRLHTACIEVHSAQMEERGIRGGAAQIERMLRAAGLSPRWVDFSHIVARRRRA